MKLIQNIFCMLLIIILTNCSVGKKEEACKYYLDRDFKFYCRALAFSVATYREDRNLAQVITSNITLVGCATYFKKKKECESEENQYLPGFYGMKLFFETNNFLVRVEKS
ncbi:hypothetical protein [Leptospira kanakyensis]|uniref:hypothetical protein n=1 Tax=Leptospira kanakyensis TaxID=2484968 RepID=UPI00223DA6C3|nr:hypothetical protein [Leptospira kanakyensis]MCW7469789.1 hypothetical protein [Leptospira kanakyensis]